jgi:hypothetical protein
VPLCINLSLKEITGRHHDLVPTGIITLLLREVELGDPLPGDISFMFHDKVLKWWQKSNHYLTRQETFLKDILQTCVDNISEQKHKETEELCKQFKKDVHDIVRTLLMFAQVVHITSDSTILSCIKVHHSLQPQCHLLVDDRTLQSR